MTCIIYCLVSKQKKLCYIGKTKQGKTRLAKHRHDYKRHYLYNTYGYCSSFKIIECPDAEFVELMHVDAQHAYEAEKTAIKLMRYSDEYKLVNILHNSD